MKRVVGKIDWVLFGILLFAAITPLFYKTYRTFLVSSMGNQELNFAVSWGYLYLIFEAVNVFVIVPAYSFLKKDGKDIVSINKNTIKAFAVALISIFVMMLIVSLFGIFITNKFIDLNPGIYSFEKVYEYILLFGFSLSLHLIINLVIAYLILNNKKLLSFLLIIFNLFTILFIDTLFLTFNNNVNLLSISFASLTSSVILLFISVFLIYFFNIKNWNIAFKTSLDKKWGKDFKTYIKNGSILGLETIVWNILFILGVVVWLNNSIWETSFWIMDGIFWNFLLVPAVALQMFVAESLSNEKTQNGKKDVLLGATFLNLLVFASWIIFVPIIVLLIIPFVLQGSPDEALLINQTQILCWTIVLLIAFQVPTKTIYTYFATSSNPKQILKGTIIGGGLIWGLSFILFLLNVQITEIWWISIFYGLGILFIFLFYMLFIYLEFNGKSFIELINNFKQTLFKKSTKYK